MNILGLVGRVVGTMARGAADKTMKAHREAGSPAAKTKGEAAKLAIVEALAPAPKKPPRRIGATLAKVFIGGAILFGIVAYKSVPQQPAARQAQSTLTAQERDERNAAAKAKADQRHAESKKRIDDRAQEAKKTRPYDPNRRDGNCKWRYINGGPVCIEN